MYIYIKKEELLDALCERVKFWAENDSDEVRYELFCQYYKNLFDNLDDSDKFPFSVKDYVDNDVVNNFSVLTEEEFEKEECSGLVCAEYTASDGKHYLLVEA